MSGNDQRLIFVRLENLVGVGDGPRLLGVGQSTLREVCVGRLERLANRFQTDAVAIELIRVYFDAHGGAGAAPGKYLADAFDLCELLGEDGISGIVDFRGRNVLGGQDQQHDRSIRGIDLAIGRLAGKIGGKLAASGVDGGLDVASGGVDIAIEIELQSDAGRPEATRGSHLGDAGDAAKLALEGRGDCRSHGFRACARQAGAHGNSRKINLRKRRNRQESEGHYT